MRKGMSFLCGLAMICMSASAQTIPMPPRANGVLFPEFDIKTTEDARKVFVPGFGSPDVEWVKSGEQGYVKLPVPFKDKDLPRASWDLQIKADLSNAKGVEFDFYCDDLESFSAMHVYFHSGDGWYNVNFGADRINEWYHVKIIKSSASVEGKPAGWAHVDTIRLSSWCYQNDHNSVAAIANLRPIMNKADILFITADSCVAPGNGENKGYTQYAGTMAACLDKVGIDSMTVSDLDVTDEQLAKSKVVILGYNPRLPEGLGDKLIAFLKHGGKILACYNLPVELRSAMGMEIVGWEKSKQGRFKGFLAKDPLPGQYKLSAQGSPHTTVAKLTGKGRILATWAEDDGTDTGIPGLLMTDAGIFMGHVWYDANGPHMTQLLQAMIGYMVPDIWQKSAKAALANVGYIGKYYGIDDLQAHFPKNASTEARAALQKGVELQRQAVEHLAAKDWHGVMEACEMAQDHLLEAICSQHESKPGEHRGFWCHSAFGLPGNTWDESIKFLKDNGFNVIHPNMLWGGLAYYPSKVLPVFKDYAVKGDQVRQCIDACKKYGVECHVWKVNWNMGGHLDAAFVQKIKDEKRYQVTFAGEDQTTWLCPSNPLNRRLEADAMVELVRKYPDLDGIHFDYIRYPGSSNCFCDGCRERFEQRIGRKVANWPADTHTNELKDEWLQFRRDNITALVKLVHDEAKAVRKNIQISAALFSNWKSDRDSVGQDWELWCRNGWMDFACPMDYTDYAISFKAQAKTQKGLVHGVKLYPGIGLSCWKNPNDPLNFIEQIEAVRNLGLDGFTVFNFDNHARKVLPFIHMGCTK